MIQEHFFAGARHTRLFRRAWRPQRDPRAIVVIVHGWTAHSGMYEWPAQQLVQAGFAVHAADLRGHGKSDGERYHVDSFDDYVTDLTNLVAVVRAREGAAAPLFVLGHSAGGVIGCLYVLRQQKSLAGFICEDFAHDIPAPAVVRALVKGVAHIAPHARLPNLKDEGSSRDSDPLAITTPATVQILAELIRANERLRTAFPRITLPVLIMHGTADHVAKPEGSKFLYDTVGSKDKTLKLYEGYEHDLLNEDGKEAVMADALRWLNAQLQPEAVATL
jgi:alpha-beta hydrolase superfamily lysophospholipase